MNEPETLLGVRVRCGHGHTVLIERGFTAVTDGGCFGHGPDEYCYCPPMTVSISFTCPECPAVRPAIKVVVPD